MHSNGIAYDIIKRRLPVINEEIAKTISNIVDLEVFFKSLQQVDVLIKHPNPSTTHRDGLGAEDLASMGIRLALLSVSSLPKGNIFILDELETALDVENMEGFIRMLDLVKTYFKTVILISHLDSLKDIVDMEISIDKITDTRGLTNECSILGSAFGRLRLKKKKKTSIPHHKLLKIIPFIIISLSASGAVYHTQANRRAMFDILFMVAISSSIQAI